MEKRKRITPETRWRVLIFIIYSYGCQMCPLIVLFADLVPSVRTRVLCNNEMRNFIAAEQALDAFHESENNLLQGAVCDADSSHF